MRSFPTRTFGVPAPAPSHGSAPSLPPSALLGGQGLKIHLHVLNGSCAHLDSIIIHVDSDTNFMTGHFCGGRTHLLTQRNGGGGWGGQDGRRLRLREESLPSWHAQPCHPLPTATPSSEREEPERHKRPAAGVTHPAGPRKVCPGPGVGLPVGGTSCAEPFPAGCHSVRPRRRRGSAAGLCSGSPGSRVSRFLRVPPLVVLPSPLSQSHCF